MHESYNFMHDSDDKTIIPSIIERIMSRNEKSTRKLSTNELGTLMYDQKRVKWT